MAHKVIEPKVLYFGTPVVLVSTLNPDGTANLAPMSSAWWLGTSCLLGYGARSQTPMNIERSGECVLNLPSPALAAAVDAIALFTGTEEVPPHKLARGYAYERHKFERAGVTPVASDLVAAPRVAECPVQLEAVWERTHAVGGDGSGLVAMEVRVVRTHVDEGLLVAGSASYIDPQKWDPLIMKFCELYGYGTNVRSSELARGWKMPALASS